MVRTNFAFSTAKIISAYLSRNPAPASELPGIINCVSDALKGAPGNLPQVATVVSKPYFTCRECSQRYGRLHRHVIAHHGITIKQYEAKWGKPVPTRNGPLASGRRALKKGL